MNKIDEANNKIKVAEMVITDIETNNLYLINIIDK